MTSREEILRRVRDGLRALPAEHRPEQSAREYGRHALRDSPEDRTATVASFARQLEGHGATVYRTAEPAVPEAVAAALGDRDVTSVLVPEGLPPRWITKWSTVKGHRVVPDTAAVAPAEVEAVGAVVTTCAGGVADTGAIVLNGGTGQGRNWAQVLPQCHVCVVWADQIEATLPEALERLDPTHPVSWLGGAPLAEAGRCPESVAAEAARVPSSLGRAAADAGRALTGAAPVGDSRSDGLRRLIVLIVE